MALVMREGRRRMTQLGVFAGALTGLCLVMASPGHAAGGFTYGLTVSPVPAGGQAQVLSTSGTTYDYGSVNLPDHVSVTPWFKPMDPATLPGISSCDAFLYRNGAQWGAQVVPLSPSPVPAFVVSMSPPVRWDVKIVCTYANAQPVPVTLLSEASPPAAAVATPKPSATAPASPVPTPAQRPAAAKPVAKVATVSPPSAAPTSIPAAVSPTSPPSVVAPAAPPRPSATPRVASSSPSVASPLVDTASPVSTPAAALAVAPKAKGGGTPWVLLILVCVVVAFGGTLFIRSRGLH